MAKESRHFRLEDETRRLLDRLKAKLGISHTALVELAIRRLAKQEGIDGVTEDSSVAGSPARGSRGGARTR